MQSDLIPFREWCKSNGFGVTFGYNLLNKGEITAVKVGRLTFISRAEAQRWAESLPKYEPPKDKGEEDTDPEHQSAQNGKAATPSPYVRKTKRTNSPEEA